MDGLQDIVVVEVAGSLAGAHCAKLFGDLGATVVGLEPPGGAPLRADAAQWAAFATSRQVVTDAEADPWLARADIVIESSSTGALVPLDAVGAGASAVRVRLSPFGERGPYAGWRGADIVDQAIGGHLYLSGLPDRVPLQGPANQAALATGVFGAIGAMAALRARRQGHDAQVVEVAHHETLAALHQFTDVRYTHAGNVLKRLGNRYAGPGSPIGMYRAADGWIAFTVATAAHGEVLLAVTGLDHLLEAPGISSVTDVMLNQALLDPALNGWLADFTVANAVDLLQSVRLAVAPVLTMTQLLDDAQLRDRQWWRFAGVDGREVRVPGPPFHIDSLPWRLEPAPAADDRAPLPPASVTVPPAPPADLPLAGVRVLDLTRVWAGPLAARIMADLGAEVVMVEAPWARTPRVMPQAYVDASHFFPDDLAGEHPWNRNGFINKFAVSKRSIGLDIATPDGRDAFEKLVPHVDVIIENYSPRVMPNLGLSEERLRELNPSLVYVTMPGYGRTGPARDYSAYGPVLDSHAGLSTLMGYPERDAWKCGIAWPDPVAGIHAAFAMLAALWQRDLDPARKGTTIEVAQFETAVSMVGDRLVRAQLDGANPPIPGNRHPDWAPQGVYAAFGDDRWLAVTVPDDDRWSTLCELVGLPAGWGLWDVADRRAHHDEIDAAITAWSGGQDHRDAAAALQAVGVPAAPVVDAAELVEDPHLRARGFFAPLTQADAGTQRWHGLPVRLSGTPSQLRRPPARLGEHNREILRDWAGLDDATIDALIAAGTVADEPPA